MGTCFGKCVPRSQAYQHKIQVSDVAQHYHKKFIDMEDIHSTPLVFRVVLSNFRGRSLAKKGTFIEVSFSNDKAQTFTSLPPASEDENPQWNFYQETRFSCLYDNLSKEFMEIVSLLFFEFG